VAGAYSKKLLRSPASVGCHVDCGWRVTCALGPSPTPKGARVSDFERAMKPHLQAYRQGRWRALILSELILDDMRRIGSSPTVLDIGCGKGFDDSPELQSRIAASAGRYIGVEPDTTIECPPWLTTVPRSTLEEAPIEPGSIQVAFAIMVLEHVTQPGPFFDKLHSVLAPNGVFWGLTVDARHWFRYASTLLERLRIKNWYLDRVAGTVSEGRYVNYPTAYRANSPWQIERLARGFSSAEFASLQKVGQLDSYLPRPLRSPAALVDRFLTGLHLPGAILVCRLVR
jgi:SAM-dependent methyltransferase